MELEELHPGGQDLPLEAPPTPPEPRAPRRRTGRWLWVLIPAAVVCLCILLVALNWKAVQVKLSPLWALGDAVSDLPEVPEPLSLGFLGTVELGDVQLGPVDLGRRALNCSGDLAVRTGEEGMCVLLRECTLGADDFSTSFSVYLSSSQAAARVPILTGGDESWYGVDLGKTLTQQVLEAGLDMKSTLVFGAVGLVAAQTSADSLRDTLSAVKAPGLDTAERDALVDFLKAAHADSERRDGGFVLHFTQSDAAQVRQLGEALRLSEELFSAPVQMDFTLTGSGALQGVALTSGNLCFDVHLGDEPKVALTPRLEAHWADGDANPCSLTLALTLDRAGELPAPEYKNAFTLLPNL